MGRCRWNDRGLGAHPCTVVALALVRVKPKPESCLPTGPLLWAAAMGASVVAPRESPAS
jgi:hypothetical protein